MQFLILINNIIYFCIIMWWEPRLHSVASTEFNSKIGSAHKGALILPEPVFSFVSLIFSHFEEGKAKGQRCYVERNIVSHYWRLVLLAGSLVIKSRRFKLFSCLNSTTTEEVIFLLLFVSFLVNTRMNTI